MNQNKSFIFVLSVHLINLKMAESMFVRSGVCRKGRCGDVTDILDLNGDPLCIGDIVIVSEIDGHGICSNHGIHVVVNDRWTTYNGGDNVENLTFDSYIMGWKGAKFNGEDSKYVAQKVKSYSDVVDGEHWAAAGINYKLEGL